MKIIYFFLIIYSTIIADINISNNKLEINKLEINELDIKNNSLFNNINFNDDIFINGNIIFNNGIFSPYISSLNDNISYLGIDKNNKIWKIGDNINQAITIVNNINGYKNNLNINNPNQAIIFDHNTVTNIININTINQMINNNLIEFHSPLLGNESLNIIGNNTGSITTDNDIKMTILSNTININAINGNNIYLPKDGILTIPNNTIFDLPSIDDINNFAPLTITEDEFISNKIDTSGITKYKIIYNQNILNLNAPSIFLYSNNDGTINIDSNIINWQYMSININNEVKTINCNKIFCENGHITDGTFNGDDISCARLYRSMNSSNATLTAYGKDFVFNNLINNTTSYLITLGLPITSTGTQLVLDSNEELFYLAQSSQEFKENIRPLVLESDRFLEIFQDIENTETVEDLILKLEHTELNNVIIYDENKKPNIIEERGLMAVAAAQLNYINDTLESLEKELKFEIFY